jgi:hypothetical protein
MVNQVVCLPRFGLGDLLVHQHCGKFLCLQDFGSLLQR